MNEHKSKRKFEKRTYPRKVKKTWRLQVFCHLLDIRIQVRLLDDWLNHFNDMFLMCEKRRTIHWVTGLVAVIKPILALWLGLEGDNFFGLSPPGMTGPFLRGWSSFPSLFRLYDPLMMTLGANKEAPSLSFYLHAVANTLTKALCLTASISVKGKRRTLDKQMKIRQREEGTKGIRIYAIGSMCLVYKL